jgi:hypothetical protein
MILRLVLFAILLSEIEASPTCVADRDLTCRQGRDLGRCRGTVRTGIHA